MQYASSIKYGGLLIDACDCNHTAYQNLGLVCPSCHESVFLTAGHERYYNASNKKTKVVPHFSHRPDKDKKEVERCKLRIAQITTADIIKSENASRNQRLRLFNRHLWNLLRLCYKLNDFDESISFLRSGFNLVAQNDTQGQVISQAFNELLTTIFISEVPRIHKESECHLEKLLEKTQDERFVPTGSLQSLLATWRQTIDKKMHVAIYNEVVDCLVAKKHQPILQNLITLGLYNFVCVTAICERDRLAINERITAYNSLHSQNVEISEAVIYEVFSNLVDVFTSRNSKAMEAIAGFIRDDVLEAIAFTPWAEGFEKFSS
ncbi:hypothetical protein [Aliterella atlantica]|uniref:Uncharacterized protein n=1 Tax=Aliterella atlantica CENA595 TaxID=1618023 RepID=A0A0D8ZSS1_9CYAN|nr:hypothetical protein [Aliterella atlantica]KJH70266.1 hypothetical protein UH38_19155 [Aliterella atlantica CENA595]